MPELLLEIFSEEIPARMQSRAADDLSALILAGLKQAGLVVDGARSFATPRRLTLHVSDVPAKSPTITEERRGPRVGAPQKALEGFMRSAGLDSLDQAEVVSDAKKGDFYVVRIERKGELADAILAQVVPDVVRKFPWPKSMRWSGGRLRWVRPIHSILCVLDGKVVPFSVDGIQSGTRTVGHRFMGPDAFDVAGFDDYSAKLKRGKVLLEADARARKIDQQAQTLAAAEGLELVADNALLRENAGLVEWPTVMLGTFDESFLDVPSEVLITSMKAHQKCFSLKDPATGKLANKFMLVSNLEARDKGKAIVKGNERVIRARLSDAKFFWDHDLATPLEDMVPRLSNVTFHDKLGTQGERVERIVDLAGRIAEQIGGDVANAKRAALLAIADLVSEMVGEFPELQGLMGRYYASAQGEPGEVAQAIEEHYLPQGPSDPVPTAPVSIAVSLADKLNTLVGFWAIDEKPTGSKDPFALRRAALGVVRTLVENEIQLPLFRIIRTMAQTTVQDFRDHSHEKISEVLFNLPDDVRETPEFVALGERVSFESVFGEDYSSQFTRAIAITDDLLSFLADRIKVYLRDKGARHDLIDAVFSLGGQDDVLLLVMRVEALGRFLDTDDGSNLLTGVKRAQNILRIEEKKDGRSYGDMYEKNMLKAKEEKSLAKAIEHTTSVAGKAIERDDFETAMTALAELRVPVDAFFDNVTVNIDDPSLRQNRLQLLSKIRDVTLQVADFTRIAG